MERKFNPLDPLGLFEKRGKIEPVRVDDYKKILGEIREAIFAIDRISMFYYDEEASRLRRALKECSDELESHVMRKLREIKPKKIEM